MRAVVFSGGGAFGAYHVGVWKVLAPLVQPGLIVGVSIGSLNGWMAAAGWTPAQMESHWLDGETFSSFRWRIPKRFGDGVLDSTPVHSMIQRLHHHLKPEIPYACVALKVPSLKGQILTGDRITWRHLAASCAVPFAFDAQRIDGKMLIDGGILDPLPLWAARDLGATRIIGINCMTWGGRGVPNVIVNQRRVRAGLEPPSTLPLAIQIRPSRRLAWRGMITWHRPSVLSAMEQGTQDAQAALQTFGPKMFRDEI